MPRRDPPGPGQTCAQSRARAWALDLDGSLIDLLTGKRLRPGARELTSLLSAAGVRVVLWSAGGSAYAEERARHLGLAPYVSAYYDKVRSGPGGPWQVDHMALADRPSVCVDDQPEYCPGLALVIAVRPYISEDASDTGLAEVFVTAERWVLGQGQLPEVCAADSHPDTCGEQLAVIGGVAKEQLGTLGPLEVKVGWVFPGEANPPVNLNVL